MLVLLFLLWLILNGRVTAEIVLLGLLLTLAMALFMKRAFAYTLHTERKFWSLVPLLLEYALCLLWEVIKANCAVARAIWNKKRPLHQALVTLDMGYEHSLTRYLFANSITLTPGTITVSIYEHSFVVHCLSLDLLDGVESGRIAQILGKVDARL